MRAAGAKLSFGQLDDLDEVRELLDRVRLLLELMRIVQGRDVLTLADTAEDTLLRAQRLFDRLLRSLQD